MKFSKDFRSKIITVGGAYNSKIKRCIKLNNLFAIFISILLIICFSFLFTIPYTNNHTYNESLGALNSSTTYYKDGSNFFTLSSTTQHYKCTNGSHSGDNDYTTSSVSGTCYSTNTDYTTSYYSHSCSAVYNTHSVVVEYDHHTIEGVYGGHVMGDHNKKLSGGYHTCRYCGARKDVGNIFCSETCPGKKMDGECQKNFLYYQCVYCGKTGSSGPDLSSQYCTSSIGGYRCTRCDKASVTNNISGNCTISGYKCSYCNKTFSSNSTASCTSRSYRKCDSCGGNWNNCSCKYYYNHSISKSYLAYNYVNIDTGGSVTASSAYTTATGYTITFNSNGGSGSMTSQYFLHGHSQAIKSNAFSRSGYEFIGWNTSSSASTASYTNNQAVTQITSGSSATLYAIWKALNYTVIYEVAGFSNKVGTLEGGFENTGWNGTFDTTHVRTGSYALKITASASVSEVTVTTTNAIAIDSDTKSHIYYFQYWGYQETALSNGTTQIYWPIEEPSMGSIKLGAAGKWNMYSFYGARSSNSLSGNKNVRIDFDNSQEAGTIWFDDFIMLDLTNIFGAGNEPTKNWCDLNIVSGAYKQIIGYDTNTALTGKPTNMTATGYTFKGWSTTPRTTTQQNVNYNDKQTVNNITSAGGTITLYGVWEQNKVQVDVTVGANGTVTPGTGTVGWGDNQNYLIQANDKYKIEKITVDGENVNFNPNNQRYITQFTYTLKDVREPKKLKITFTEIVKLIIDVQDENYQGGCYIYHTDYDNTTTTTETVTFYAKAMPGFRFIGWSDKAGNIVSTSPYQEFEFVKDDEYNFLAVLELMSITKFYTINSAGDLLAFVNVANYSEAELYGVQVQLNRDIDISNLDIYTKYGFESFPNLQKFSGYFEYNGFQILKDGKYFNIYTGTLSDEPQGEYTDIM